MSGAATETQGDMPDPSSSRGAFVPPRAQRSRDDVMAAVASVNEWYHRIAFPHGIVSPGINDSPATLAVYDDLGLPRDMTGMRVLDIGCADGFFSFVAEARGATEVVGLDYRLPTATGFAVARELLGSRVRHVVDNVYNLDPAIHGRFDFVFFVGVIYHLRNPLLAMDRVRGVVKDGGSVLVESNVINDQLSAELTALGASESLLSETLRQPLWRFFVRDSLNGDPTNKWAPTLAGLAQVCEEAQLTPVTTKQFGSRGAALCVAVQDSKLEYQRRIDAGTGLNVR